jgi:hypothetical protein
MNCWFTQSVTDSFGASRLASLHEGPGLPPGSCCPHYDGEAQQRPAFHRLISVGEPSGVGNPYARVTAEPRFRRREARQFSTRDSHFTERVTFRFSGEI